MVLDSGLIILYNVIYALIQVIADSIISVLPWAMTVITFDEEKCCLTLQTTHKEEALYARNESDARDLYRQISNRSLGTDFS